MPSRLNLSPLDRAGREGGYVSEMQRRRLLLAFTEILAENGLQDTGIGRVCKRAGVSRRTFYDLFRDREACFLAVVDNAIERVGQSVIPIFQDEGRTPKSRLAGTDRKARTKEAHGRRASWRERVRDALAAVLEFFDEQPALARVLLVETLKAGPAVSERRRRVLDLLTRAIDEGRAESKAGSEPPPLIGQSTVGGAISVIHARILEGDMRSLVELLNPLMSMIVHPYLGPVAARRELDRRVPSFKPVRDGRGSTRARDPFRDLPIRVTFRTARVLTAIGSQPGASNRQVADASGVGDQGQMSKLLSRLDGFGLVANHGQGQARGEPNAWRLTERGADVLQALNTNNDQ